MINNNLAKDLYNQLLKKYKVSLYLYATMTVIGFTLTASLIIFNLFAIRFNPANVSSEANDEIKTQQWLFIGIAILSAVQAFMTGMLTLFTFRKRAKSIKHKIERINIQIERYRKQEGDYESVGRDATFINLITKIINE